LVIDDKYIINKTYVFTLIVRINAFESCDTS